VDIDTRSDIYSLGVLLYELLTGKTPFDPNELMAAGLEEMRRTLRDKEPLRPSTKLGTLPGEELSTTAQRRSLEAPKLISLLRGDLDWIAMKCLEKDRSRRYETANGLVMDIQRHLNQEPVVARPPSVAYRLQKAIRRHRVSFAAAGGVAFSLVAGFVVSTWQAVEATRAKDNETRAKQQLKEQLAQAEQSLRAAESARQAESLRRHEQVPDALAAIDQALSLEPLNGAFWELRGDILRQSGLLTNAVAAYTREIELVSPGPTVDPFLKRALLLRKMGQPREAATDVQRACKVPNRDPMAASDLLDLSAFYNAGFKVKWHGQIAENDLSELPVGVHELAGTLFDVRGIVQLGNPSLDPGLFPVEVVGVPLARKVRKVHFLHSAIWGQESESGSIIAKYAFHYVDGSNEERAVILGRDVLDWWEDAPIAAGGAGLVVAWTGFNTASRKEKKSIHLYKTSWENPRPDTEVASIDLVSTGQTAVPFVVAITVE
jgi:tetratricopeptide (TPR) repeat protein